MSYVRTVFVHQFLCEIDQLIKEHITCSDKVSSYEIDNFLKPWSFKLLKLPGTMWGQLVVSVFLGQQVFSPYVLCLMRSE